METTPNTDDNVDLDSNRKNEAEKRLKAQPPTSPAREPFVVRSRWIGIADKVNLDNIEEALDILEEADRKW